MARLQTGFHPIHRAFYQMELRVFDVTFEDVGILEESGMPRLEWIVAQIALARAVGYLKEKPSTV